MPVDIFDLVEDRRTITVPVGKGELTVTYRPNQLTPARELAIIRQARAEVSEDNDDPMNELETAEYSIHKQIENFIEVVESWDFKGPLAIGPDGQRLNLQRGMTTDEAREYAESHGGKLLVEAEHIVPLEKDYLYLIGSNAIVWITDQINQDMRPKKRR